MSGGVSASTAIAVAGLAAAAASTGVAVYSSVENSAQQSAIAKYQAKVAQNNALAASNAAADAKEQGRQQALQQTNKTRQLVSAQVADLAANGIDVGQGTATDITQDTINAGNADVLTIQHNANKTADAYLQQGQNFNAQSVIDSSSGGNYSFIGTGLSGLGTVADKWYKADQAGLFSSSSTISPTPSYNGVIGGNAASRGF